MSYSFQDERPPVNSICTVKEHFKENYIFWAVTQRTAQTKCEVWSSTLEKAVQQKGPNILFTSFLTKAGWPWTCEMLCEVRATKIISFRDFSCFCWLTSRRLKNEILENWWKQLLVPVIKVLKLLNGAQGHSKCFCFRMNHKYLVEWFDTQEKINCSWLCLASISNLWSSQLAPGWI